MTYKCLAGTSPWSGGLALAELDAGYGCEPAPLLTSGSDSGQEAGADGSASYELPDNEYCCAPANVCFTAPNYDCSSGALEYGCVGSAVPPASAGKCTLSVGGGYALGGTFSTYCCDIAPPEAGP